MNSNELSIPNWVFDVAAVFLMAILGFAGTSKILVPDATLFDIIVGVSEVCLAIWIFTGFQYRFCCIATIVLAFVFLFSNVWSWVSSDQHCNCYGLFAFPWSVSFLGNLLIVAAASVRLMADKESESRNALLGLSSVGLIFGSYFVLIFCLPGWRPASEGELVNQELPQELQNYVLDEELSRDFVMILSHCRCSKCIRLHTKMNNLAVRLNKKTYPQERRAHARVVNFCDIGLPPVSSVDGSETYKHIVAAKLPSSTLVKRIPTPSVIFVSGGNVSGFLAGDSFDEWLNEAK